MSRLTHKDFDNNYYCYKTRDDFIDGYFTRENKEWFYGNVVDKLGKLEDIEEELGCPLEVVFEALSKGIEYEIKITTFLVVDETIPTKRLAKRKNIREIKLQKDIDKFVFLVPYDISRCGILQSDRIYLKDYQKTWWLKGERNE